ncbi:MAG: hypothetical protein R3F61_35990 [Myxococcota bacterium]
MQPDVFWTMLTQAVLSAPLLVMWLVGVVVGIRLLGSCRPAGICLILAGLLELGRNGMSLLLVPMPAVLKGAGVIGDTGLSYVAMGRGVVSVVVVCVAYALLIAAMFGWRGTPAD